MENYIRKEVKNTKSERMVKIIGMILLLSSLLSLVAGIFIDLNYAKSTEVTGNVILDIIRQPSVEMGFLDYAEAIAFSYSIISMIVGFVFVFRA